MEINDDFFKFEGMDYEETDNLAEQTADGQSSLAHIPDYL